MARCFCRGKTMSSLFEVTLGRSWQTASFLEKGGAPYCTATRSVASVCGRNQRNSQTEWAHRSDHVKVNETGSLPKDTALTFLRRPFLHTYSASLGSPLSQPDRLPEHLDSVTHCRMYSSSASTQPCWKCGSPIDKIHEQHFCKCGMVQPPISDKTHFEVMRLDEDFDVDISALAATFRELQRLLHPDKFSMKSSEEQEYAKQQSSRVNQAYKILRKPLSRALYLLKLNGHPIEEGEIQIDPEFLMDIMEINEQIAESSSETELNDFGELAKVNIRELTAVVSDSLKDADYPRTKAALSKLKYYANIEDKVEAALDNIK